MAGPSPGGTEQRMKFAVYPQSWQLRPDRCPCDLDFVDYIRTRSVSHQSIFHFGSGEHHIVGRQSSLDAPNDVLSITTSPREHAAYINLVMEQPEIAAHYKVLFADIYTLTATMLPRFDVVTLFHLHEFSPPSGSYACLDDESLLALFCDKLQDGGRIIFYRGSDGFAQTRLVLDSAVATGRLAPIEQFASLSVYGRPVEPAK
jgi:hypothetical protein